MTTAKAPIDLIYDPLTLPTPQHRAGLAGLLVLADSMERRGMSPLPRIIAGPDGRYTVALSPDIVTALFNELYDAVVLEVKAKKQRTGKGMYAKVKRRETRRDEQGKEYVVYIYGQLAPKAAFLEALQMPAPWLKLWRDAVWETVRSIPKTRRPYEDRRAGNDAAEARTVWSGLVRFAARAARGQLRTEEVASSLYLGAQALNAERVPFRGRTDENFLLHFWPVVMGVYIPEGITAKGEMEFRGYILVVPDVVNVGGFAREFRHFAASLDSRTLKWRPRSAVVSVPQEGGLEYLDHAVSLVRAQTEEQESRYDLAGVDIYRLDRGRRSAYIVSADRIAAADDVLSDYRIVRDKYAHVLFRRQLILNLLKRAPWYAGFERMLSVHPHKIFLGPGAGMFQSDVRTRMQADHEERRQGSMEKVPATLSGRVHRLVREYVNRKTEARSGIKWEEFKDQKIKDPGTGRERVDVPQKYREAREKVCNDAFLRVRASRSQEAFISYFTGTICSVPQYLPGDEYQDMATLLLDRERWEEIRALAMLALSSLAHV